MAFQPAWSAIPAGGGALHRPDPSGTSIWTTVNAAEVFPGVPTPLTWAVCGQAFEMATRIACVRLGALPRAASALPAGVDDRFFNVVFGRAALNASLLGRVANAMPGSSSDALELAYFGVSLDETSAVPVRSRYPVVAGKAPVAAARARRDLRRLVPDVDSLWRTAVLDLPQTAAGLRAGLAAAQDRVEAITTEHVVNTMIGQGVFDGLRRLAEAAGCAGQETAAVAGVETPEARTVDELRELAHGRGSLDAFVAAHGFHGPAEGELLSRTWREDRAPLVALVEAHRRRGAQGREPGVAAAAARRAILDGLPRAARPVAGVLIDQAREYARLREVGRTTLLKAVDVCRAHARALGATLFSDPDDVFFLLPGELERPPAGVVAERRAERTAFEELMLPERWTGSAVEAIRADTPETGTVVAGLGAAPGTAEGTARVVSDPTETDIEDGDILVCHTTDPGWASYFELAAAVVIDVGAFMRHGAIVAREVGIPCVIGTKTGTRVITDGDRIRVDGGTGEVEILKGTA